MDFVADLVKSLSVLGTILLRSLYIRFLIFLELSLRVSLRLLDVSQIMVKLRSVDKAAIADHIVSFDMERILFDFFDVNSMLVLHEILSC